MPGGPYGVGCASTLSKRLDPGRVNVIDPVDPAYWCKEVHCTAAELAQAVNQAGEHAAAICEHLESRS